ncbi:MAG: helix-turn-helix transcriptional regulator [Lachnospiraceae bacterium]|nr:helix-turn-helix transcriptional regulator [Lachnospiraceae bacterium]
MDVLDRIIELRNERNWTEYQLAENAGITQSTISSWYRKHMLPTIPSLQRICDGFGIPMSQFFLESPEEAILLTDKQFRLLEATRKLTPEQYDRLLSFLDSL